MKEKMSKLIEMIIANKVKAVALSAAAVVTVTGAVVGVYAIAKHQGGVPAPPTISEPSESEVAEVTSSEVSEPENVEVEEVVEATSDSASSEVVVNTSTESTSEAVKPAPSVSKNEPASSTPNTSTPADTTSSATSNTTSSTETRKFVKPADTSTGISWDGVSPIVYTYSDGSTGTEPKIGATYEYVPGMIGTVYAPVEEVDYDGVHCTHCGKVQEDGTNGTCLRYWTGGDHECQNCGAVVPEDTCHTCDE